METFLVSALLVALAEMGDRTQLLTMLLATRYREPLTICLGVLVATLANHLLAALAGYYIASILNALWFRYLIGASFIVMAAWVLIPDKESDAGVTKSRRSVFLTTVLQRLLHRGDGRAKRRSRPAALAARFHDVPLVAAGTTTGMMIANIPAAYFGHTITRYVPLWLMRYASAAIYVVLGLLSLAETAGYLRLAS